MNPFNPQGFFPGLNGPMMGQAPTKMNVLNKAPVVGMQHTLYIGNLDKKVGRGCSETDIAVDY